MTIYNKAMQKLIVTCFDLQQQGKLIAKLHMEKTLFRTLHNNLKRLTLDLEPTNNKSKEDLRLMGYPVLIRSNLHDTIVVETTDGTVERLTLN